MDQKDKSLFDEMLCAVFKLYNKPVPDNVVVKMYYEALNVYTLEEIREALNRHVLNVDTGQFVPKPADIARQIQGNTDTQSETAWTKVDKAIRSVGPHRDVCFDDSIIHAVITDMGGWVELCRVTEEEYPFKHNEFVKRYRGYIGRPPKEYQSRLIGIDNGHNARHGFELQPPLLIGDKEKAVEVLQIGQAEKPKIIHRADEVAADVLKRLNFEG